MSSQALKNLRNLVWTPNFSTKYTLQTTQLLDVRFYDTTHPLYRRQREKEERQKDSLLIYMIMPKTLAKNATVRHRCKRRINEASRLALKEHGYTLHGRPIESKISDALDKTTKPGISGTILFLPGTIIINEKWDVLCQQVKTAIDKFVHYWHHGEPRRDLSTKRGGKSSGFRGASGRRTPGRA